MDDGEESMKKLYLSDLHIGDGTLKDDFKFDEDLIELIESSNKKDFNEIVIVGDGLELLTSEKVKEKGMISYKELLDSLDVSLIDRIEERHRDVFKVFREFSKTGDLIYIVGNHDSFLLFKEELRDRVRQVFGGNDKVKIVPYYLDRHFRTLAIHGNQYDIVNRFFINRKTGQLEQPFGDFMARFMMENFDHLLMRAELPEQSVRDYQNIHPTLDVFQWFDFIRRTFEINVDLQEEWSKNFVKLLKTPFAKVWIDRNWPVLKILAGLFINRHGGMKLGDFMVRMVMATRKFRKTDNLYRQARRMLGAEGMKGFRKAMNNDYFAGYGNGAPVIVPGELKGVIMGHNHRHVLRMVSNNGEEKFYANTGTWKPVVELIDDNPDNGFARRVELGYITIEMIDNEFLVQSKHIKKLSTVRLAERTSRNGTFFEV
jgi:UDP-2,3-diacylglucosamine pyrophosphatase LpxH